ncbi:MAG: type I restriction endonuclease subunit R, partial [Candidatus Symbiothrix sp.]|nr:type I restriction endonuclease subunit R [Candidatus Symbiothrix sp.]
YTDLNQEQKNQIEVILPDDILRSFRSSYIETAKQFKEIQQKEGDRAPDEVKQLDFEFVLFASTLVDYDYIMSLIANNIKKKPAKQKMTKSQVISLLSSSSNLMDEQEDLTDYIKSLDWNSGQNEKKLREGYQTFKDEKIAAALSATAQKYGLETTALQNFVERIMSRMIFDGEQLSDLLAPLELSWKARTQQELALMDDLMPLLKKLAAGRDISGLSAYE